MRRRRVLRRLSAGRHDTTRRTEPARLTPLNHRQHSWPTGKGRSAGLWGARGSGNAVLGTGEAVGVGTGDVGDGAEDVPVAGAAAQHAGKLSGELFLGDLGLVAEQVVGAEQEARRAETALQRVVTAERLLQRVQLPR